MAPRENESNRYVKVLGCNRGVLWDCASSEFKILDGKLRVLWYF